MKNFLLFVLLVASSLTSNAQWIPVGGGVGREVTALVEYNGYLIIGGWFTSPGNYIATWNGTSYGTLGTGMSGTSLINSVNTLCVYKNELYAGGSFSTAGGTSALCLAKWNGASWSAVGTGLTNTAGLVLVTSMCVFNNELYVGGLFDGAGGVAVNNLAKWDGTTWSDVNGGTSVGGLVNTMAVHKNQLYVAGAFTTMGGVTADRIAKWNGGTWGALGTGNTFTGGNPLAMASNGTDLFLGGGFTQIGSTSLSYIGRWNDTTWNAMGTGADQRVNTLFGYNGDIYCGGDFVNMNGTVVNHVAKWANSSWSGMNTGTNTSVFSYGVYNWGLYVGGIFTQASGVNANYIALWDAAIGVDEQRKFVSEVSLYPNPFSDFARLNISESVGSLDQISVVMYDIAGREVNRIINPSSYTIDINGSTLTPGIYIYQVLKGNEVVANDKFIVR